jgi:hypothetical protein
MKKVLKFLNRNGIYILIGICLLLGLISLIFKNATLDDDLYLWETSMMADAMQQGEWIGNYAVGTHGFLFKLPVAIVFLFTSPSLLIATVWNILLACITLYLFYLLLKEYFKKGIIPLLGSILMFTNFQFILHLPTYMREIPVLFTVVLFLYLVVKKKSYWLIGLSLMLIFDAKEYVLFMILPAYLFYILVSQWKGLNLKTFLNYFKIYISLLFPTVVLLLLMIFTQLVPVNMFALSPIPGVTKGGVEYHLRHFDVDYSTTNRMQEAPTIQREIPKEKNVLQTTFSLLTNYIGKILYPRTFSFLSIPKVILFPALFTSILLFRKAFKKKDTLFVTFSFLLWQFLLIYIFRASFDRYLFPILPIVIFFFILFLKDLVKEKKKYIWVVVISSLLAFAGLFFEPDYILIKLLLNVFLILGYLIYLFAFKKGRNLFTHLILFVSAITFCVVAYFFYANGQLRYYLLWGNDYEIEKVVTYFDNDEKIVLNDVGWDILPKVYRGDNQYNVEWRWEFEEWVPRKKYLKILGRMNTFGINGKNVERDKTFVQSMDIQKLGLMVSTLQEYEFRHQNKLEEYLEQDWLELIEVVPLRNKELYIFEVKQENE